MTVAAETLDQLAIDTIRTLSIDGVQQANSGHPGAPMGAAPMAYTLWTRFLRHAPHDPKWPDRDRFVLSAGHASMLLYSLLHLTGYDLPLDELKRFRQWGSRTPGHPEYGLTRRRRGHHRSARPGLRQRRRHGDRGAPAGGGVRPARPPGHRPPDVRHLLRRRPPGGDRVRGREPGRAPPAGQARVPLRRQPRPARRPDQHGLGRGRARSASTPTAGTPSASTTATTSPRSPARSSGPWRDPRPSLIAVRTHIGYGSPNKHDSQKAHGAPLGPDEVRLTKEAYGWDPDKTFYIPDEVAASMGEAVGRGQALVAAWEERLERYAKDYPAEAEELRRRLAGSLRPTGTPACRRTRSARTSRRGRSARPRSRRSRGRSRSSSAAPRTCRRAT